MALWKIDSRVIKGEDENKVYLMRYILCLRNYDCTIKTFFLNYKGFVF